MINRRNRATDASDAIHGSCLAANYWPTGFYLARQPPPNRFCLPLTPSTRTSRRACVAARPAHIGTPVRPSLCHPSSLVIIRDARLHSCAKCNVLSINKDGINALVLSAERFLTLSRSNSPLSRNQFLKTIRDIVLPEMLRRSRVRDTRR